MRTTNFKHLISTVLFLPVFLLLINCTSSQQPKKFSIDTEGMMDVKPDTMVKDAIRLKGQVISKSGQSGIHLIYDFEVTEVIRYGATFSSVEPSVGDQVKLYVLKEAKLKIGNEMILDATTRKSEEGGIILNMISK